MRRRKRIQIRGPGWSIERGPVMKLMGSFPCPWTPLPFGSQHCLPLEAYVTPPWQFPQVPGVPMSLIECANVPSCLGTASWWWRNGADGQILLLIPHRPSELRAMESQISTVVTCSGRHWSGFLFLLSLPNSYCCFLGSSPKLATFTHPGLKVCSWRTQTNIGLN